MRKAPQMQEEMQKEMVQQLNKVRRKKLRKRAERAVSRYKERLRKAKTQAAKNKIWQLIEDWKIYVSEKGIYLEIGK